MITTTRVPKRTKAVDIGGLDADEVEAVPKNFDRSDRTPIPFIVIAKMHDRIQGQRLRATQDDPIVLSCVTAEVQPQAAHHSLLRDADLDEILRRLTAEVRKT